MILLSELVPSRALNEPPIDHRFNMSRLHYCLNFVRRLYGQPMTINSGYRTKEDHFRIYEKINEARKKNGQDEIRIPMGSCHLIGAAADIADHDQKLKEWVLKNISVFEDLGLYLEDFDYTPTWCHIQIYPPGSGERFFKP